YVVVDRHLGRAGKQQPHRFQVPIHQETARVTTSGHGGREDLMPEHCRACGAVPNRDGRVRGEHVAEGDLRSTSSLDDTVSDECLVYAAGHNLADDCGGDITAVRRQGDVQECRSPDCNRGHISVTSVTCRRCCAMCAASGTTSRAVCMFCKLAW